MKVKAIVGSLRKESYNKKVLLNLERIYGKKIDIIPIDKLPLFNQDIENDDIKDVENFYNDIKSADVIIISSPEYNYSIPGVLKNALDWASRGEFPLKGKDIIVISASIGRFGGVRMQTHLREVLRAIGAKSYNIHDINISSVHKILDGDKITDEYVINQLEKIVTTINKL